MLNSKSLCNVLCLCHLIKGIPAVREELKKEYAFIQLAAAQVFLSLLCCALSVHSVVIFLSLLVTIEAASVLVFMCLWLNKDA